MTPPNRPTSEEIAVEVSRRIGRPYAPVVKAIKEALDKIVDEKDGEIAQLKKDNNRLYLERSKKHAREISYMTAERIQLEGKIRSLELEVIKNNRLLGTKPISVIELQASLSLALGALKSIAEDRPPDTQSYSDNYKHILFLASDALSSPAIQKEVQRIEAMERVIQEASLLMRGDSGMANATRLYDALQILEAIKAYEESSK